MRTRSLLMTALLGLAALSPGQAMAYETCAAASSASADVVGTGSVAFSTVGAVRDGTADLALSSGFCDRRLGSASAFYQAVDVYYKYEATTTGFVDVTLSNCTLVGTTPNLSSGISISLWDCNSGTPSICDRVQSSTNFCNSKISISTTAGQTYIIRVATFATSSTSTAAVARATGNLVFTPVLPPTNENCATAQPINGPGTVQWSDLLAQPDGPLPSCGGLGDATQESGQRDLWYRYTATTNGVAYVFAFTQSYDVVLSAAPVGGGCPSAANTYCSRDAALFGSGALLSFPITNNAQYFIRFARYAPEAGDDGTLTIAQYTTPANDTCATAQTIPMDSGAHTGSITWGDVAANANAPFPACGVGSDPTQRDVWFNYTATQTGTARFAVSGTGAAQTSLAVYTDCTGSTVLDCKGPNEPAGRFGCFSVTSGQTYKIRIARPATTDTTNLTLSITEYIPYPQGETCDNPLDIPEGDTFNLTNIGFCDSPADIAVTCRFQNSLNNIWLRYTPTATGIAFFNTIPPDPNQINGTNTMISAFSDCNTLIDCNDDRARQFNNGTSYVSFPVVQGVPVLLRIATFTHGVEYVLNLGIVPPLANDECAGATNIVLNTNSTVVTYPCGGPGTCTVTLPPNSAWIDYDNLNATTSNYAGFSCTAHHGAGENDLWYKWTAPANGQVAVGTCWNSAPLLSSYVSIVEVYDNACGGPTVACNDNYEGNTEPGLCSDDQSFTTFNALAGHTYIIRVGGQIQYFGFGKLYLRHTPVACPADFNNDGARDVADLFAYINAWLAKTSNANFNGDSSVDVADLFAYINAWLAGC